MNIQYLGVSGSYWDGYQPTTGGIRIHHVYGLSSPTGRLPWLHSPSDVSNPSGFTLQGSTQAFVRRVETESWYGRGYPVPQLFTGHDQTRETVGLFTYPWLRCLVYIDPTSHFTPYYDQLASCWWLRHHLKFPNGLLSHSQRLVMTKLKSCKSLGWKIFIQQK